MTTIIIITYLSIGILSVSVGPLSKNLSEEIKSIQPDNSKTSKIKKAIFSITLILFGILLYPLFYYSYFFQNGKKMNNFKHKVYEEGKLYFDIVPGTGNIVCKDCNHTEVMTSFTHGMDAKTNKRISEKGYQCKDCGKLCTISNLENENEVLVNCKCGGTLQRDNPIFCPKCKSTNILYHLKFMT